jgi:HSP20 family protein
VFDSDEEEDVALIHGRRDVWQGMVNGGTRAIGHFGWRPAANLYEVDGGALVRVEAAGLRPGDYRVRLKGNRLVVFGERRVDSPPQAVRCHRVEMPSGRFRVELPLPWQVDGKRADVAYDAGILSIFLPRS